MLYPATLQEKAEENQMQCKLELGPSIAQGIAYIPRLLVCHPLYRFHEMPIKIGDYEEAVECHWPSNSH